MNENPGETPNPLNAAPDAESNENVLDANPAEPIQEAAAAPVETPAVEPVVAPTPVPQPEPVQKSTPEAMAQVESLDPTGRPMEKPAEVVEQPKRKKTGLIVGIIIGLIVLIGGGVAAALVMMNMNKSDAVAAAMQKIMSGQAPKNVAIDGDINILVDNESVPIKRVNIDLDSDIVIGSMINTSSAVLTFTDRNDQDYSVKFEEVYAANDNLFFKIEGATAAIEDSGILNASMSSNEPATNCFNDETGNMNCENPVVEVDCSSEATDCVAAESSSTSELSSLMTNTIVSIIEAADGIYLRISADDMGLINADGNDSSTISCVANLVSDIDKNSNSAAELYNKYPFITSTNKNITVSSKQNPIYKIGLDSENFVKYVNSIQNSEVSKTLYSCLGANDSVSITEEDVNELVNKMPAIYAEINADNNFTRLYLESDINDGLATATIDLGFSYPTNVNVTEPVEYTDYSEFIQTLFTQMYNLPKAEAEAQSN